MKKRKILISILIILTLILLTIILSNYIYLIEYDGIKNVNLNYFLNKDKVMKFEDIDYIRDFICNPSNYEVIAINDTGITGIARLDAENTQKMIDSLKNITVKPKKYDENFALIFNLGYHFRICKLDENKAYDINFFKNMIIVDNPNSIQKRDMYATDNDYRIPFYEIIQKCLFM